MDLSEEFRMRAERCLRQAHDAPTLEAQTHWLSMAQLWLNLAQYGEEQEASFYRPVPFASSAVKRDGDCPAE
jgi:hypothetical protein